MKHPTDEQLEGWLRSKEHFDREETVYIREHLETCRLCEERVNKLREYYKDLEGDINKSPGEKEKAIASKVYQRRTRKAIPSGSLIQTYEAPLEERRNSLPIQIKNYLQQHAIGSISITFGTIFFAVLLFIVQPWSSIHGNPTFAEVERNVLYVYNEEGESLWNMVIDGIPNGTISESEETSTSDRLIRIADIDGDSRNEVLLTGHDYESDFTANTVYCYNSDGTLRWSQNPPKPITFGDVTHSSVMNWEVLDFFTLNTTQDTVRLFVTSNSSWFPSVLFELDTSNGNILQSYWHPGWIFKTVVHVTEDNNEHIILGATNNSYQKAALIVLDPENINGHSPLRESYKPNELPRADEIHYILFKPSRLNELFGSQLYNITYWMKITNDGGLMARARENLKISDKPVAVMYTLNNNYEVLEARGVARYQRIYTDLYNEGELQKPLTDQYWESLKDSVLYWDDATESFISQREREE